MFHSQLEREAYVYELEKKFTQHNDYSNTKKANTNSWFEQFSHSLKLSNLKSSNKVV
ncbi:hypothetical protein ACLIA0_01815 [Bacillaceae bacterium W0354]